MSATFGVTTIISTIDTNSVCSIDVIMERGPGRLDDIERLVAKRLAERYGDKPLRLPLRGHVLSAVAEPAN